MSSSCCVIVDILANEVCCLGKGVLPYRKGLYSLHHRVDRVLSFFCIRRNWDRPTTPSPAGSGGGTHCGRGGWGTNLYEGTDTRYIYVLCNIHYLLNLLLTTCIPTHRTNEDRIVPRQKQHHFPTVCIRILFEPSVQPLHSKISIKGSRVAYSGSCII